MRRGFTMIELVFVIVILGILAAIAIPRLAASRDDARAVSLKTDIGTLTQAVPAWYQSQGDISIENAMQFDVALWNNTAGKMAYQFKDSDGGTIDVYVMEYNVNGTAANLTEDAEPAKALAMDATNKSITANLTVGNVPWLVVSLTPSSNQRGVVYMLTTDMKVANDTFVPMAGKRVIWN